MDKVESKNYMNYIQCIDESSCGIVYPHSIVKEFQKGDVFSNSRSFLFWHFCGFAFLYGEHNEYSLELADNLLFHNRDTNSRRSVLFITNKSSEQFFRKKENVMIEQRYFFEYKGEFPSTIPPLSGGYKLCELNSRLLDQLHGRVTPYFSWENSADFLEKGKGFCIIDGNKAAAWAFTAAISDKEIDIGIETNPEYQRRGLAYVVAERMIQYCAHQHKRPVWACHSQNIASRKLAEKLGFVKTSQCWTIKKCLNSVFP